jgi:hypothetical protein
MLFPIKSTVLVPCCLKGRRSEQENTTALSHHSPRVVSHILNLVPFRPSVWLNWVVATCVTEAAVPCKQQFTPLYCSSSSTAAQEQVAASSTAAALQFSELHGAAEPSTGLLLCSLVLLHPSCAPGQREKPLS